MIKLIAIVFLGSVLVAFLFTVFVRSNNEKNMDKFLIILFLFALTACTSYRPLVNDCELEPTVVPPGKTWKQVQDSCKTKMDF